MYKKRFVLKMSALAVLTALGQGVAQAYTQGVGEFATVEQGEAVNKVDGVTAEKPNKVTGVLNRSGNPVRIIWYGNENDSDGKIPQKGAVNKGFIQGTVIAQGVDSDTKTEYQSSIQVEGQGNAIDALGWTAHTNPNSVEFTLESIKNEGVALGQAGLNGGLGSVHGRVETYGSGNAISIVGTADYGKSSYSGVDGVSGASSTSSSASASVESEITYVSPKDLRGTSGTTVTPPAAYDSDELNNANMYGKNIQIALKLIQNTGKLQGELQAKANQEINNPVTSEYYPQFFGVSASAVGNGVSVSTFINTPDKYTYSDDKLNTARLGDVYNDGNIFGKALLVGGKNTTHTQTLSRGTGNGISAFAASGNYAQNKTHSSIHDVTNTGRIEGYLEQNSGNNSGYPGAHLLSTAESYSSGNGISTFTETLNAQTKASETLLGNITNSGRIAGSTKLNAGNGTGDLSVTATASGNGISTNVYGGGRKSVIGKIENKGLISGAIQTKAGVINGSAKTGTTIENEENKLIIAYDAGKDNSRTPLLPAQSANAARLSAFQGIQTIGNRAATSVYASGNGISAYADNRLGTTDGGVLGDVNNTGVISGYAQMYHGVIPSSTNVYQRIEFLGVGAGIFADRNISSNITNLGIISGNYAAMLAKGEVDTTQSVYSPTYKTGFTGSVKNYGLMSGIVITGNYRDIKSLSSREQSYTYFATKDDPITNHGTYVYLAGKTSENSSSRNSNPWLVSSYYSTSSSSASSKTKYGEIDRIVVAANSTQTIDGKEYAIINAPLTQDNKDSEYRPTESTLAHKIINGAGVKNGALVSNSDLVLDDAIVNGYGTSLKLEDGHNVTVKNSALNTNGFNIINGTQAPMAVKGSEGVNHLTLENASFINGNIALLGGDDSLKISGGDVQVNGQAIDLGEGNDKVTFEAGTAEKPVKVNYAIQNAENLDVNGVVEATSDAHLTGVNQLNIAEGSQFILKVEDVIAESSDDLNAEGKTVLTETAEKDADGNILLAEKTSEVAKRHALYDDKRSGSLAILGKGTFVVDTAKAVDRIDFGSIQVTTDSAVAKTATPDFAHLASTSVMQNVKMENGDLIVSLKKPASVKEAEEKARQAEDAKKAAEIAAKEAEQKAAEEKAKQEAAAKAAAELAKKQAEEQAAKDAYDNAVRAAAEKIAAEQIAKSQKQADESVTNAEKARTAAEQLAADKSREAEAAKNQADNATTNAQNAQQNAEQLAKAVAQAQQETEDAKQNAANAAQEAESAKSALAKANADLAVKQAELTQAQQVQTSQFVTPYVEAYASLVGQATDTTVNPLQVSSSLTDKAAANQAVNAYLAQTVENNIYAAVPSVLLESAYAHREATLAQSNKVLKAGNVSVSATGIAQQSRFENVAEKAKSQAAMVNIRYGLTDKTSAGIALAHGKEEITGKNSSQFNGNSLYVSGYVKQQLTDAIGITAGVAYENVNLDGTRIISNGYDSHRFDVKFKPTVTSVYSQVNGAIPLGETVRLEPKAGVAYNRLDLGDVQETGTGALSLEKRHYQTVDFSVGQDLVISTGQFAAKLGVDYLYTSGVEHIRASFNGGNGFDLNTDNNRSALRTSLSAEYTLPVGLNFKAGASNTVRKSGNMTNVNVGVGYTF